MSRRSAVSIRLVLALVALAVLSALSTTVSAQVLVSGDPPLTGDITSKYRGFFEWLLDAQFTVEQRDAVDAALVDAWNRQAADEIASVLEIQGAYDELSAYDDAERDMLQAALQPELLSQLREQPEDEMSRWLLDIYDAAHQPIADGKPPLTRQASDAYAEALLFMVSEVGGQEYTADRGFKDAFAEYLAGEYAWMPDDERQTVGDMPIYWAAIRAAWPDLSEEERDGYREGWRESVGPIVESLAAADAYSGAPEDTTGEPSGSDVARDMAAQQTIMMMNQMNHNLFVNGLRGNPFTYTPSYVTPPRY